MKHLLSTLLLLTSFTFAQSSSENFNFQGFHMIDGKPANGNFKVTFKVFDEINDGNELWTSGPIDDLPLVNGVYQRALGQNNGDAWGAIDWSVGNKFIEVVIGDVAKERTQLMAVPIAIGAHVSSILSGQTAEQLSPTGSVIIWMMRNPPTGYLECNGQEISRSIYPKLFSVLGTTYGVGNGTTTFNLPDMRGFFPRGWDHGADRDPNKTERTDRGDGTTGDNIGTKQEDAFQDHSHAHSSDGSQKGNDRNGTPVFVPRSSSSTANLSKPGVVRTDLGGTPKVSSETRPKNINVMYCIKH